jgi:hypothetical protein
MRVDATDNNGTINPDTYAISVYDANNNLYLQAGTTSSQISLGGGNIVMHQ